MIIRKIKNFQTIIILIILYLFSFVVSIERIEGIPLCLFKAATGFDCPGCGLLRSFISISHGDFVRALHYHFLGPVVYILFFLYLIESVLKLDFFKKKVFSPLCFKISKRCEPSDKTWIPDSAASRGALNRLGLEWNKMFYSKFLIYIFMGQWLLKLLSQASRVLF